MKPNPVRVLVTCYFASSLAVTATVFAEDSGDAEAGARPKTYAPNSKSDKTSSIARSLSDFREPPKTSCGLELDKIPAVFVAKAPTITR
jgi:hypothetical protein